MIVIYNFGFGCKVDPVQIKAILRRPVAPVIGFCCQFLIMAPLSYGFAQLLKLDNETGRFWWKYIQKYFICNV